MLSQNLFYQDLGQPNEKRALGQESAHELTQQLIVVSLVAVKFLWPITVFGNNIGFEEARNAIEYCMNISYKLDAKMSAWGGENSAPV